MAIAAKFVTKGNSASDTTVYTSASVTITASTLVLIVYAAVRLNPGEPQTPTVASAGLTGDLVEVASAFHDQSGQRAKVWVFRHLDSSTSAGTFTFTHAATHEGAIWIITEFSGIDTGGTKGADAVRQSSTNINFGTSLQVALAGFGDASNATFLGTAWDDSSAVGAVESLWTEIAQESQTNESDRAMAQWIDSPDQTPSMSISGGSENIGGVALEIVNTSAPAPSGRVRQMGLKGSD